jgi:transcriptional regulator with XRE-family HTH domain
MERDGELLMEMDPPETQQPSDAEQEALSQRLREAREYLGLSQEYVAEQLGIPRAAVSAFESAKRKVSSLELKRLAQLYRRSYDYLLGTTPPEPDADEVVVAAVYRTTKNLSAADKEQLLRFAQFLEQSGGPPRPDTSTDE